MRLYVSQLPTDIPDIDASQQVLAIVVDTLRFTTAACEALANGASSLSACGTVEEAQELARSMHPKPLLCGERECRPIPGFDLGNSPYEYKSDVVGDRKLIFTTTNGTRAVQSAQKANETWLAALTNREAVCQQAKEHCPDLLWIVCSGTNGRIALEDALTAGAIASNIEADLVNDSAILCSEAWSRIAEGAQTNSELRKAVRTQIRLGAGGRNVINAGYARDLEFASEIDTSNMLVSNRGCVSKCTFKRY